MKRRSTMCSTTPSNYRKFRKLTEGNWFSELCISFQRAHSKEFKNKNFMEIKRSKRKLWHFFIFVVKMTNFDLYIRDGHVIHHIKANEPRIIIDVVLAEQFYLWSKCIKKFNFWKFSPIRRHRYDVSIAY